MTLEPGECFNKNVPMALRIMMGKSNANQPRPGICLDLSYLYRTTEVPLHPPETTCPVWSGSLPLLTPQARRLHFDSKHNICLCLKGNLDIILPDLFILQTEFQRGTNFS